MVAQDRRERYVGALAVEGAVLLKEDNACGINKIKAEVGCEDNTVEVLAAACCIVTAGLMHKRALDTIIFFGHVERNAETCDDRFIALDDLVKIFVKILAARCFFEAAVEHIGNLCVFFEAFTGCGRDNVAARRIFLYDLGDFLKVFGICQRRTAEFDNFYLHFILLAGDGLCSFRCGYNTLYYMLINRVCQASIYEFSRYFSACRVNKL